MWRSAILSSFLFIILNARFVEAINRTVGPQDDSRFRNISRICDGDNPEWFTFGKCTDLIDCVYSHIGDNSPAFSLSLSMGSSIVGLLPTVLALIGSPPLELLQLAILAPHRALATSCFGIGLPVTLFRQLRPLHQQLAHANPVKPRERQWTLNLAMFSARSTAKHIAFKILADVLILGTAGVMVWQNWIVNTYIMIPWRCEYWWLLFAWPLACMAWLLLAVSLMFIFKEKMIIHNAMDDTITYSIWQLMILPYTLNMKPGSRSHKKASTLPQNTKSRPPPERATADTVQAVTCSVDVIQVDGKDVNKIPIARTDTVLTYGEHCVTVRIIMPSNFGFRSWRTLETAIEVLAVGIYLYATFVLMSALFLNSDKAMQFATIMGICLSAVRVLGLLF